MAACRRLRFPSFRRMPGPRARKGVLLAIPGLRLTGEVILKPVGFGLVAQVVRAHA